MANADRIIELLHEAKARPAGAEREQFLAEMCRDDAALKEQIISLLKADAAEGVSDFLKSIPIHRQAILLTEKPGDRIGRYKLLEQIGEGGCGVVYMAEQEEPVRRRVALKVIKLGMDTKQVIARFEAERQALAMMDHPNIAKIFDAGVTGTPVAAGILPAVEPGFQPGGRSAGSSGRVEESEAVAGSEASPGGKMPPSTAGGTPAATLTAGRPFFVMELVRGIKITDYCDQNNLPTNERLELFMQVCQAIQHAHQKGIIHRDIKPSNILVTQHDDVAVPKVIDFGIAKATVGQLTDKTVFTAFAQFIGTPAYMSPEQAQMSGLDIDTRADIYSLGVLLYELLTGHTPFDAKELLAAGMDEMRRKIREDEPAKPSTCLSTMQAMDLTTVAKRRHVEPPKLIHLIRGDLDWLVMKCLEKDRTRRYETANGLAVDIQRHLNNEPVTARPPSNLYRFQKLIRRNKLAFAAGAIVLLVLLGGIAASTWQAIRATRAELAQARLRQEAEAEAARSQAVSQFLKEMLNGANPFASAARDRTLLKEILDRESSRIKRDLTNQPAVQAELQAVMGEAYDTAGEFGRAEQLQREALATRRRLRGKESLVADSLMQLSNTLRHRSKWAEAESLLRECLAIRRRILPHDHEGTAEALRNLGKALHKQDEVEEAETVSREALAMRRRLHGNENRFVADSLNEVAEILERQDKLAEAEILAREALAMQIKTQGAESIHVAIMCGDLALILHRLGQTREAIASQRQCLTMMEKFMGAQHSWTSGARERFVLMLIEAGEYREAETMMRQQLIQARSSNPETPTQGGPRLGRTLYYLANIMRGLHALAEARSFAEESYALYDSHPAWAEGDRRNAFRALSEVLAEIGDLAALEALHRKNLEQVRARRPADVSQLAGALAGLTHTLLAADKSAEAETLARECLVIYERETPEDWRTFEAKSILGGSLLGQKKYAEAEPLLLSGYEGMKQREEKISAAGKVRVKEAIQRLVQLYEDTGESVKAAEWTKKLAEFDKAEAKKKASAPKP